MSEGTVERKLIMRFLYLVLRFLFIFFQLHTISKEEQHIIQQETLGQNNNKRWMQERLMRITASNFGRICKATERTDLSNLATTLMRQREFSSKATAHGQKYESVAVEEFERIAGQCASECGLFVDLVHPWLAASPDRLLTGNKILEVKCPYTSKDKPINHVTVPYLVKRDSGLTLRKDHDYYYQVQGQLMCCDADACMFVVFTMCDIKIIEIKKDEDFIESMLSKLQQFFVEHFYSALVVKYVYNDYAKYFG